MHIDAANENLLEAEVFLKLLAVFSISSEFDDEELCKFALALVQKRQMPELCLSLGLADKVTGVVGQLINRGKQVDAVHLVHAFQLNESFPLVPLLKTYLKDLRRNIQGKGDDENARELVALKDVIHCVQSYKLEANYPLDPLHRRVVQLERTRSARQEDEWRNLVITNSQRNQRQMEVSSHHLLHLQLLVDHLHNSLEKEYMQDGREVSSCCSRPL